MVPSTFMEINERCKNFILLFQVVNEKLNHYEKLETK